MNKNLIGNPDNNPVDLFLPSIHVMNIDPTFLGSEDTPAVYVTS